MVSRRRVDAVRSRLISGTSSRDRPGEFSDKEREAGALDLDLAAVALGDRLHDGQAEAGALAVGARAAVEALEDALRVRRAGTLVGDGQAGPAVAGADGHGDLARAVLARVGH